MAEQEIIVRPPGPDKPGYLRRVRETTRIQRRLKTENSVEAFDEMIAHVLNTCEVIVPDGVDPTDALLDLSREQFEDIFASIAGTGDKGTDPQNGV